MKIYHGKPENYRCDPTRLPMMVLMKLAKSFNKAVVVDQLSFSPDGNDRHIYTYCALDLLLDSGAFKKEIEHHRPHCVPNWKCKKRVRWERYHPLWIYLSQLSKLLRMALRDMMLNGDTYRAQKRLERETQEELKKSIEAHRVANAVSDFVFDTRIPYQGPMRDMIPRTMGRYRSIARSFIRLQRDYFGQYA